MNTFTKNLFLWITIILVVLLLFNLFQNGNSGRVSTELAYSDFVESVKAGNIREVTISGNSISAATTSGRTITTFSPQGANIVSLLENSGVRIIGKPVEREVSWILSTLLSWFPMLLLIGVWIFFMRQMQSGSGKAMGFGKSKAKLLTEKQGKVTFEDVAGIDEAKTELEEIVEFLKDPGKFQRLGGKIPKGCLLVGPPGTGKTLLAKAVAGEAGVPFFSISGSEFVEMFVGVGASRVRDLFEQAKKNAPCIVFIDEIDAVGRQRGAGMGGGNDEREQTLNQLLTEMDGFEGNSGIIIVAATNRPDVLDSALMRPGRFDRQVTVDRPDYAGRLQILNVHAKDKTLSKDVDLDKVARRTPGFTGADLANLLNEAAILAARKDLDKVSNDEVGDAIERVMAGPEKKDRVISDKKKELVAYHEAGHALVGALMPDYDPVAKVSIIPRGQAGGLTFFTPSEERMESGLYSRSYLQNQMAVALGGRVAEEIVYGEEEVTTGASNDLQQVANVARQMITKFGMSDKIGPVALGQSQGGMFLGRDMSSTRDFSEDTAATIDVEVSELVDVAYKRATKVLTDNRTVLDEMAQMLIERETIDTEDIQDLLNRSEVKVANYI